MTAESAWEFQGQHRVNPPRTAAIKDAAAEINLLADELIALDWDGIAAVEAAIKAVPEIVKRRLHG